ncbi:hypothetical protein D3C87_1907650 [compost metagenome]
MITSFVDSFSVNLPTTLAKVDLLVMGLVIFITVPIGAVRCSTSIFEGSRSESAIHTPVPFSSIWFRPYLLAGCLNVGSLIEFKVSGCAAIGE